MVSKNQIKLIKSLSQKKQRQAKGLFVAEGKKTIAELLDSPLKLGMLFSEEDIFDVPREKFVLLEKGELKKISFLTTPQSALAVFQVPSGFNPEYEALSLVLDGVRDPGNLGTIIRLCDWFGIPELVCSEDTVDCYNPKVVQATMGSIARVKISYVNLTEYLTARPQDLPVFGTFMDGENIYSDPLPQKAMLIMGNEANGISEVVAKQVNQRVAIPQFGKEASAESLNVATATAICLSEFKRTAFTGR
ncbi:RNA methyltransferase [Zunongwangia sp. F363]|uniref:RNA methyltransferase n=1 Tax=Autumnicola tepida TaxID=3075595 RepID=A0ABU3C5Q3_9FLAO|nr:RNA methyltransferase [Zunongwangia sp. F363]MDT0641661.1 RNA methyltransferase [Zunongwangia sp. F363]